MHFSKHHMQHEMMKMTSLEIACIPRGTNSSVVEGTNSGTNGIKKRKYPPN